MSPRGRLSLFSPRCRKTTRVSPATDTLSPGKLTEDSETLRSEGGGESQPPGSAGPSMSVSHTRAHTRTHVHTHAHTSAAAFPTGPARCRTEPGCAAAGPVPCFSPFTVLETSRNFSGVGGRDRHPEGQMPPRLGAALSCRRPQAPGRRAAEKGPRGLVRHGVRWAPLGERGGGGGGSTALHHSWGPGEFWDAGGKAFTLMSQKEKQSTVCASPHWTGNSTWLLGGRGGEDGGGAERDPKGLMVLPQRLLSTLTPGAAGPTLPPPSASQRVCLLFPPSAETQKSDPWEAGARGLKGLPRGTASRRRPATPEGSRRGAYTAGSSAQTESAPKAELRPIRAWGWMGGRTGPLCWALAARVAF